MKIIARIYNDFDTKFGIPRQSGLAELESRIVFEPKYRNPDALRGIEDYSHLWLIWNFSECECDEWHPVVRPPRLGGNKKMGVFATRSPYRPNPIGLSSVKLIGIEHDRALGDFLIVKGADLMNGTPIYDIKPYLAFTDCHPDAVCGFADMVKDYKLEVVYNENIIAKIPEEKRAGLLETLSGDPRPQYKKEGADEYGLSYAGFDVGFTVNDGVLTLTRVDEPTEK